MIDDIHARRVALWTAVEDYPGLWEVVWEFNGAFESASRDECRKAAEEVIRKLFAEGLVDIYKTAEPYGRLELLSRSIARQVLSDSESWQPPDGELTEVRVGATPAGEEEYWRMVNSEQG